MDIEKKKALERAVVDRMIKIYCLRHHGASSLCDKCASLRIYVFKKIDGCISGEEKTFCSFCTHPCYSKSMREEIKKVMRFSGKYMLLYHPILTLKHLKGTICGLIKLRKQRRHR